MSGSNDALPDDVLIDVSRFSLAEVRDVLGASALGRALDRIVVASKDNAYSGFTANI
jgi:hypothetical protein